MPITLISGPANAGKAELVLERARAHVAHGAEPLLIVPTRADVDHYRRELAGEGAALGFEVRRFGELIGEAVRRAEVPAQLLGEVARERLLAAIAARGGHPRRGGFTRALGTLFAELQVRRVTPARLRRALSQWAAADAAGAPAQVLGELYAAYRRSLERIGRVDEEQRAVQAFDALRATPALWGGRPLLFYGFDDLTPLQLDAIETLGVVVGADVTVSLSYEPGRIAFAGRAASFQALAPLASSTHALEARSEHYAPRSRAALGHLERALFEPAAGRAPVDGAVRLLEGASQRNELELVAAEISALLRRGVPAAEIAVVLRAPSTELDLLEEVFSAAGIPFALQRRRRFGDTAIGSALVGLLRCLPGAGTGAGGQANGGEGAAGELGGGEAAEPGRAADLLAWLRAPGLLTRPELADGLEATVVRSGISSAEQARALWEERHWPLDALERLQAAQQRGAGALAERAQRELRGLFAAPRRRPASVLGRYELDEAGALAAGSAALRELEELARLPDGLAPADGPALAEVLDGVELVSGERPGPGAVAVLDPLGLRARRVRALFLCGLQEGAFPAPAQGAGLLSEEERRGLAEASGLALEAPRDALAAERYLLYAAVSRPEELLVLSWHAADENGAPAMRSLFVDDVCDLFADAPTPVQSPAPARAGGARERPRSSPPRIAPLHDELLLEELRSHTWSASSLEVWMSCPVRWLVERLLRPKEIDPDAEPLSRGSLAHVALKQTLEGLRARTGSARLTSRNLALARQLLADALREHEAERPLSAAPERLPGLRRRLQADLERYLEHAAAACGEAENGARALGGALEPTHLELEFGFEGGLPALDLGDGVRMRGRIDRVDVSEGGEAVVYDYKGANVSGAEKWLAARDVQVALYMLAVEQLLGLRAVGGFYQPLGGADLRARGVLDADAGLGLQGVGTDARGHGEVRALLERAAAAAREAAAQAARGELTPRPATCAYRGGCAYPTICRCEE